MATTQPTSDKLLSEKLLSDKLRAVHEDESGMVTWAFLVAILFFMLLGGFVYNAGNTINRKIETQNAADAAAYSGSLWVARGMNAVTATNHLVGELNALYVLHHALGGKWLDENRRSTTGNNTAAIQAANIGLETGYRLLSVSRPFKPVEMHFNKLKENPSADVNSMIYEAKLQLKIEMAVAYGVHFAGYLLYEAGEKLLGTPLAAAGAAMMASGTLMQLGAIAFGTAVWKEYLILDGIEMLAHTLKVPKKLVPTAITTIHHIYQPAARLGVPVLSFQAAGEIAKEHGLEGAIYGDLPDSMPGSLSDVLNQVSKFVPTLPIERETTRNEQRSQLIRATYPWVAHWRTPITRFLRDPILGCPLSGAGGKYMKWTNRYARQSCVWLRVAKGKNYRAQLTIQNHGDATQRGNGERGKDIKLYVVIGLNQTADGIAKSRESWNQWSQSSAATNEIERRFCHVAFAKNKPPIVMARRFFRQENPRGMVAFAQSMVYNGNDQQQPADSGGAGSAQPRVGWDTLNWTTGAIEYQTDRYVDSPPRVKLNWQAKLTPVTPAKVLRVIPAAALTDEDVRAIALNMREGLFLSNQ